MENIDTSQAITHYESLPSKNNPMELQEEEPKNIISQYKMRVLKELCRLFAWADNLRTMDAIDVTHPTTNVTYMFVILSKKRHNVAH